MSRRVLLHTAEKTGIDKVEYTPDGDHVILTDYEAERLRLLVDVYVHEPAMRYKMFEILDGKEEE